MAGQAVPQDPGKKLGGGGTCKSLLTSLPFSRPITFYKKMKV